MTWQMLLSLLEHDNMPCVSVVATLATDVYFRPSHALLIAPSTGLMNKLLSLWYSHDVALPPSVNIMEKD